MTYTPYIWPQIFAALLTASAAIYARRFRESPAARPFRWLMWQASFWAFMYSLQMVVDDLWLKVLFSKIQHIANVFIPLVIVWLVLEYLDMHQWLIPRRFIWLLIPHLIFAALIVTSSHHALMRYDYSLSSKRALPLVQYRSGIGQRLYTLCNIIEIFASLCLLLASFRSRKIFLRETVLVSLGIACPFLVNTFFSFGLTPFRGFNFTPIALAFSGGLYLWAFRLINLFDLTPIARTLAMDALDDVVVVLNQQHRIVDFNRAAQRICGLSPQTSIGVTAKSLPAEWSAVFALQSECDALRDEIRISAGTETRVYDARVLPINGGEKTCRGRVFLFHDITVSKQAEEALRANERQLREIIEHSPMPLLLNRPSGEILMTNQAFCDLIGGDAAEIASKQTPDFYDDPEHDRIRFLAELQQHGRISRAELAARKADGTLADTLLSSELITYEGQPAILSVIYDLTDQKRVERELVQAKNAAEAANRAKSVFLANMSHELRTPLNSILGYAQILQRQNSLNAEQREGIAIIERSGAHLLDLINDILDLAKVEAGKVELHSSDVHLRGLLDDIRDMMRIKASAKHISFVLDIAPTLPNIILADERRLRQILLNLLGNAIKFTERGGVTLRVTSSPFPDEKMINLRFDVEDTGIGITEDELGMLFEPFHQAGSASSKAQGTGLGLAISHNLVRVMGGELEAASESGVGSRFWFTLPVAVTASAAPEHPRHAQRIIGIIGDAPRLLVVDDDPVNRKMLLDALKPLGFDAQDASNGRDAERLAAAWQPQAVIADLRMPEMDGVTLIRRLRQTSALADLVIFASSANAYQENQQQSLAAGADAFFPKPLDISRVLHQLEQRLRLTWRYAEEPETRQDSAAADVLLPPLETLNALYHDADVGDILAIRATLDALREADPRFAPFVAQFQALAQEFQLVEIRTRLEGLLTPKDAEKKGMPERLAALPALLTQRLSEAAQINDISVIQAIIEEIRPIDAELAEAMTVFADDFEYQKILALLERKSEKK